MIGDISMRHAAHAAGLGVFGRHNLINHPVYGTRVIYTAILTDMPLTSDPSITEDLCIDCGLCVDACPANALDEEGKTNQMRCLKNSQPLFSYRFSFWMDFETGGHLSLDEPAYLNFSIHTVPREGTHRSSWHFERYCSRALP